ncbi:MAG: PAS domain-containing protein [Bacteroidota bacterium]
MMNTKPIRNKSHRFFPLHCWDVIMQTQQQHYVEEAKQKSDLQTLKDFQKSFGWHLDLDKVLAQTYQALVLTDDKIVIQWVDKGFEKMTGYAINEALGKTPQFLQGKETSVNTRAYLRQGIRQEQKLNARIVNYRKSGIPYHCELNILPLHDDKGVLRHFLALENELRPI